MRRILVAVIAAVMTLALAAPADAAGARFAVSIKVSSPSVYAGQTVTISGKVTPGASGKTVVVQKKLSTSKSWENEGKAKIRRNGTFSFTDRPSSLKARSYRVYKPKQGKRKAGYSTSRKVTIRKPVRRPATLTVTSTGPTTLDAGQRYVLKGTASANLRGTSVQLQVKDGSGWTTLVSSRVKTDRTFTLTANATRAGRGQKLRAYARATSVTKATASATKTFTVYGWYHLSDLDKVESVRFGKRTASIAGQTYLKSVGNTSDFWWEKNPFAEWALNYKCRAFRATIGLDDTSRSGSKVSFVSRVDSVERGHGTLANGTSAAVTVDLSGAYRLRLESRYVAGPTASGSGYIFGVWGDASIQCAF